MKYLQVLISALAIAATFALPNGRAESRIAARSLDYGGRKFSDQTSYYEELGIPIFDGPDYNPPEHKPLEDPYQYEHYEHRDEFLGPSTYELFQNADLDRSEVVVLVGSGLAELMRVSLEKSYGSGMQEFKDVSLAMVAAARHVLENRVAKGIPVTEKQFENLQRVEERLSAVMDAIAATFDENVNTRYSLPNFFKTFDFTPVERSRLLARIIPSLSKTIFQAQEGTTAQYFSDAYDIFLPAIRKFLEERVAEGKKVPGELFQRLERAERLQPALNQAFVTVVHDKFLVDFMKRLELDPQERAKYLVNGFFASMDAMFEDTDASAAEMMRDVTLAYIPASRQVFEDRLAAGKPVTQENFDNLERMERTLPVILNAYVQVVDDLGIP
ncbi:uncharacterized protein LOC123504239 isoform X1 [Portunus trituberculatus]|uniref:uncharacterized protein LOC123504239 isoform X1 n=1 Tax=Portunus trituberculatus TaxID=210409 RepID=UPI001E1D0771|nr:uncharacterized protein LOC123504239 isoform X1 [Portunus trituberculatus]